MEHHFVSITKIIIKIIDKNRFVVYQKSGNLTDIDY